MVVPAARPNNLRDGGGAGETRGAAALREIHALSPEGGRDLRHCFETGIGLTAPLRRMSRVRPVVVPAARLNNLRDGGGAGETGGAAALRKFDAPQEFAVKHDELVSMTGSADEEVVPDQRVAFPFLKN